MTRKRLGKSLPSTIMKEDHHSLWETLSASLSPDGTSLVAVFRENIAGHQNRRVKVIVWEFHASDDNRLISWKAGFWQATENAKAGSTTGELRGRDNNMWQQLLSSRPVAPSTEALEVGTDQDWADVIDLYEDPDTLPENWPPESTHYLAAFKD